MRPPELRNPGDTPESLDRGAPVELPKGSMKGGTIAAEEIARRVVRAIERRDLYVLTHPEQRECSRRRAAKIDAMFEEGIW
jgi:hypothetical protein